LIFVNTRFFEYAILFRKLQEVDEMKDEFISMASHELRAPIAAINGYVVMFIEGGLGTFNEAGEKGLKIVRASIQRLGNLVEDLLDVSRIEQNRIDLTLKPLKIQNVIKQTLDEQKIQADAKGIELKHISRADWQPVYADSDKLRQILVNLIGNAIKYTKNGSVQIDVDDAGSHVKVKIKDTGIGISAANREHLFDKFYRVKNEQTKGIVGTGLGLWITKRLIELMGGKIFVDSIENVGTEFSFTIKKASPTA
jgi:signal transduction histidine kinase